MSFRSQLPHDEILNPANIYRYDLVPMFQNETISGRVYAVLTAYFVHPGIGISFIAKWFRDETKNLFVISYNMYLWPYCVRPHLARNRLWTLVPKRSKTERSNQCASYAICSFCFGLDGYWMLSRNGTSQFFRSW